MRKYTCGAHEAYKGKQGSKTTTSTLWSETESESVVLELAEESGNRWMDQMQIRRLPVQKGVEDPEDNDKSKWEVNSEGKKARRGSWTYMLVYVDDILMRQMQQGKFWNRYIR